MLVGGIMGQRFIIWLIVCAALGLGFEPAQARDRKSAARERDGVVDVVMRQEARAALLHHAVAASPGRTHSVFGDEYSREETAPAGQRRKAVTLFRFNSKLGEVAVQPVFGAAKGAQFSLGF
jgi:hypothetical protein